MQRVARGDRASYSTQADRSLTALERGRQSCGPAIGPERGRRAAQTICRTIDPGFLRQGLSQSSGRSIRRTTAMSRHGVLLILAAVLLAGCTSPDGDGAGQETGRCLYVVKYSRGQMMKWHSCDEPPAMTTRRLAKT